MAVRAASAVVLARSHATRGSGAGGGGSGGRRAAPDRPRVRAGRRGGTARPEAGPAARRSGSGAPAPARARAWRAGAASAALASAHRGDHAVMTTLRAEARGLKASWPAARSPSHATSESVGAVRVMRIVPERGEVARRGRSGSDTSAHNSGPDLTRVRFASSIARVLRLARRPPPVQRVTHLHDIRALPLVRSPAMEGGQRPLELILARNLLSSLSTPAFLVDEPGDIAFYNDAAGALLGRRYEDTGRCAAASGCAASARSTPTASRSRSTSSTLTRAARQPPGARRASASARRRRPSARDRGQRLPARRRRRLPRARSSSSGPPSGARVKVRVWGARGSVPTPGPDTMRYGGNTSCVQVTLSDGTELVLDAGTGIRPLGLRAAAERPAAAHPAHAPAPGPHPGADVLRAGVPARSPRSSIYGPVGAAMRSLRDRIGATSRRR